MTTPARPSEGQRSTNRLFKEFPQVRMARATSWRESALLGFANGVFWAPTAFWQMARYPLLMILDGMLTLMLGLAIFFSARLVAVLLGLCGCLQLAGWGFEDDAKPQK